MQHVWNAWPHGSSRAVVREEEEEEEEVLSGSDSGGGGGRKGSVQTAQRREESVMWTVGRESMSDCGTGDVSGSVSEPETVPESVSDDMASLLPLSLSPPSFLSLIRRSRNTCVARMTIFIVIWAWLSID